MWYDPADTGIHEYSVRFYYAGWQAPDDLFLRIHTNAGGGTVRVHWLEPAFGPTPDTIRVCYSPTPWAFQPYLAAGYANGQADVTGLPPGAVCYFQLRSENAGGCSLPSETLAVQAKDEGKRFLVVNGFDRFDWDIQETDNLRYYTA